MIKAVILDLDDTLFLNGEASFVAVSQMLERMDRIPMTRKVFFKSWGLPFDQAIRRWSPGIDLNTFTKHYFEFFPAAIENKIFDIMTEHNLKALDDLTKLQKKLVVVTSRNHTEIQHLLESDHALADRIDSFYYKNNTKYQKPDSRVFEEVLTDNKLLPKEVIYVGDTLTDAQAANGAGLYFVASLESGVRIRNDFSNYQVDVFIDTFPEILEAVKLVESRSNDFTT